MKNIKLVNLRFLAILLVVLGHSIIIYSPSWGLYQTTNKIYILELLKEIINIVQMPIFFFISGYLFYKTIDKKINFNTFLLNKFKRLLLPFLIVGILWMIPIKYLVHYEAYQNKSIITIIFSLLLGKEVGHLWYVIVLFIIFILMFQLRKILKSKSKKIDLILFIIFLSLHIFTYYKAFSYPYVGQVLIYSVYFYFGILLNKYEFIIKKLNKVLEIIIGIILIILSLKTKNQYLTTISALVFIITIYQIMPNKTNKIISKISEDSFGIYLFHSPLIYITYSYLADANPIIVIFLNFIIFGSFSLLITEILRKTKLRLIIGE